VLVVTRYRIREGDETAFLADAREALDAFAGQPGHRRGHLGRSTDEPDLWLIVTEWEDVGSYRRALSAYDVKMRSVPVMYRAVVEPTAYEVIDVVDGDANPVVPPR
jgi:quinol monooxygenase YgiN